MGRFLKSARKQLSLGLAFYLPTVWAVLPVMNARGQSPGPYRWQIERLQVSDQAWIQTSFTAGDLALAWLDIPPMFTPVKITEVGIWWGSETRSPHGVATDIVFYDAEGTPTYLLEGAVLMSGYNPIPMPIECAPCQVIFDEGPIGIGVQYLGEYATTPPVSTGSGHVLTGSAGCWPSFNYVFDQESQSWVEPCPGLNGNFGIRVKFEPLCPERIGDINGDLRINAVDSAILAANIFGPGDDIWDSSAIYADCDNDYDTDLRDWALLQNNFTSNSLVSCGSAVAGSLAGSLRELLPGTVTRVTDGSVGFLPEMLANLPLVPTVSSLERDTVFPLGSGGGTVAGGWNIRQISVALVIVAIVSTLIIGPCVTSSCRNVNRAAFVVGGSVIDDGSIEETRIRAAMNRLQEWGNCRDEAEEAWFALSALQFNNPWLSGNPRVNYQVSEDDLEFAACRLTTGNLVILHHTFVTGEHWNKLVAQGGQELAISGIALLLFAEWQHMNEPGSAERPLQVKLAAFKQALKNCGEIPQSGLYEEFGHGYGD